MSRPTAISPEEQEQIARRIGVLLLRSATEDWQQITVEYRATGDYHDLLGEVTTQSGAREAWEPPEELVGVFEHLREGMYRPDVGTWLSALYVVERPSSYRIDINFDTEPQWNRPLPRAAYVDEFRRYPRAEENIPDWVQAKLNSSSAPVQEHVETPVHSAPSEPEPAVTAQAPMPPYPAAVESTAPDRSDVALRRVAVFDGYDEQGRPVVTARKPVAQEELAMLRQYLENAPVVVASQNTDTDRLDPNSTVGVATNWHTDGTWLWPDAVGFYLAQYGVPPQNEFADHIRQRQFTLPEVDEQTREAARREVLADTAAHDEPPEVPESASPALLPLADETAPPAEHALAESVPVDEPSPPVIAAEPEPQDPEPPAVEEVSVEPEETGTTGDEHDAGLSYEPVEADEEAASVDEDAETVLSILRKKLSAYEVDENTVGIAQRIPQVRCLVRDGSEWLVTAGEDELPSGEARFARIDQAAAYLLGSVLLYRAAPERPSVPPAVETPAAPPPLPEPPAPEPAANTTAREQPADREPAPSGHFLFTDNKGQAPPETSVPPPRQGLPDRAVRRDSGLERQAPAASEVAPFQSAPRPERPAPPSPPTGQPAALPPAAQGPTPGQAPPPLPKRSPRSEQNGTGRPPERLNPADRLAGPPQPGSGGPGPAGGAERRPGPGGPTPAGPPRQSPMPGAVPGGGQRPPQGPAPGQGLGREQQIQPLQGEPPLTLFRDRRPTLLQPGTEVDRFGDPTGNVTYIARTPYSKRSLPPQWSGRPYVAYRVQRPVHALQGTAVPWFEQPGGGTAYVLPAAITDLLADGTLVELSGNEAPRPPME
jgi:hypothetical protein